MDILIDNGIKMQYHVENAIAAIGNYLKYNGLVVGDPCDNSGAVFEDCSEFKIRAQCWCEGDIKAHEDECPKNFEFPALDFSATWYKYLKRNSLQNKEITPRDAFDMQAVCFNAIDEFVKSISACPKCKNSTKRGYIFNTSWIICNKCNGLGYVKMENK